MSERCGEINPNDATIVCQKTTHPWGAHFNQDRQVTWKGQDPPVRTKQGRKQGTKNVAAVINSIQPSEHSVKTGPPESGERRRDIGMEKVLSHTDASYKKVFAEQYRIVVNSGEPFTSEDVTAVVGMPPGHVNAVGAQFSALVGRDIENNHVVYLKHVKAQRAIRNAAKIGQYRKVVDQ